MYMAVKGNLKLIFDYYKLNLKKEWKYKSSFIRDCERVLIFFPLSFLAILQYSQLQNTAGNPSAAAVPRYVIFIILNESGSS